MNTKIFFITESFEREKHATNMPVKWERYKLFNYDQISIFFLRIYNKRFDVNGTRADTDVNGIDISRLNSGVYYLSAFWTEEAATLNL